MNPETLEAIRAASAEISDAPWHGPDDYQCPFREIYPDPASGKVMVVPHPKRGATVTIELDGLTPGQALRVLRVLNGESVEGRGRAR